MLANFSHPIYSLYTVKQNLVKKFDKLFLFLKILFFCTKKMDFQSYFICIYAIWYLANIIFLFFIIVIFFLTKQYTHILFFMLTMSYKELLVLYFLHKILNHCNNSIPQIYFCLFHNDLNNVDIRLLLVLFDMLCVPPHANHE